MARYRVGNEYLSEEEYAKHLDSKWMIALFIIGAALAFLLVTGLFHHTDFSKISRYTISCFASLSFGCLLAWARNFIRKLLLFCFVIAMIVGVASLIWHLTPTDAKNKIPSKINLKNTGK